MLPTIGDDCGVGRSDIEYKYITYNTLDKTITGNTEGKSPKETYTLHELTKSSVDSKRKCIISSNVC